MQSSQPLLAAVAVPCPEGQHYVSNLLTHAASQSSQQRLERRRAREKELGRPLTARELLDVEIAITGQLGGEPATLPAAESPDPCPPSGRGSSMPAAAPRARGAAYIEALQRSHSPEDWNQRQDELAAAIGYKDPHAAARAARREREQRERDAELEAAEREAARQVIREQLGEWTKDSRQRLEQTKPEGATEERDAKRLGPHVWAVARMAACGSLRDLAYAVQQMQALAPMEAVGCWVIEAMGLRVDGTAQRQLHSPKGRRKLVRSFVLWCSGSNTRLRKIAGSPSRRTVRGVLRVPQRLLARIAAIGGKPWHRSTTTRDANEAHAAGLFRRVRLPAAIAHESERCGSSGQVVSRYWMELPRQPRRSGRSDEPTQLGSFLESRGADADAPDAFAWVREQAKQALVYAMHAVKTVRGAVERASVPGLLLPLQTASPPA